MVLCETHVLLMSSTAFKAAVVVRSRLLKVSPLYTHGLKLKIPSVKTKGTGLTPGQGWFQS